MVKVPGVVRRRGGFLLSVLKGLDHSKTFLLSGRCCMRDPNCINYPFCLSEHARCNGDLNCTGCPNFWRVPSNTSPADLAGCVALAVAVVRPEVFRAMDPIDRPGACLKAFLSGRCNGENP